MEKLFREMVKSMAWGLYHLILPKGIVDGSLLFWYFSRASHKNTANILTCPQAKMRGKSEIDSAVKL